MRFSRTRLTDPVHRRHSASPPVPGGPGGDDGSGQAGQAELARGLDDNRPPSERPATATALSDEPHHAQHRELPDLGEAHSRIAIPEIGGPAPLLRGCKPARTGRPSGSTRSVIDQHQVVTPQVLHQAPCLEPTSVRAAATTSTTPMEARCKSSPWSFRCPVMRQAGDPWRRMRSSHRARRLGHGVVAVPRSTPSRECTRIRSDTTVEVDAAARWRDQLAVIARARARHVPGARHRRPTSTAMTTHRTQPATLSPPPLTVVWPPTALTVTPPCSSESPPQ